jgi:RNA recognition motif-containing protein
MIKTNTGIDITEKP